GQGGQRNPIRDLAAREIIDHRRQPHQNCDPHLSVHRVPRKLPECSGTSPCLSATTGPAGAGAGAFLRFKFGRSSIIGARKPDCSANSASSFPDGSRQLIGSIHSIGIREIRVERRRRSILVPRSTPPYSTISAVCPSL